MLDIKYRIKVCSDIRYNVGLCSLQSDIGSSYIKLSRISLITDIGLSAPLYVLPTVLHLCYLMLRSQLQEEVHLLSHTVCFIICLYYSTEIVREVE
jgi:hypothetical protein